MEEIYKINKQCLNCREMNTLEIKKGVMISKHIPNKDIKCTNCGCMIE